MRCPYQTMVIHKTVTCGIKDYQAEVTEFGDCLEDKCPFFYYVMVKGDYQERCVRAEKEKNDADSD